MDFISSRRVHIRLQQRQASRKGRCSPADSVVHNRVRIFQPLFREEGIIPAASYPRFCAHGGAVMGQVFGSGRGGGGFRADQGSLLSYAWRTDGRLCISALVLNHVQKYAPHRLAPLRTGAYCRRLRRGGAYLVYKKENRLDSRLVYGNNGRWIFLFGAVCFPRPQPVQLGETLFADNQISGERG